ncbi:peptidyl-prolyl cis-trans isomerase [Solirubrobacter soli]|uniref:peptidyl-prolyl cis-trans isomerase n=1 Tax=Solirubrobacter soli TaxID=363832 RepID=UPI00041143DE|nr:peptidyl-prolyl cis-trans isomerase [Solirubrobacter soli]
MIKAAFAILAVAGTGLLAQGGELPRDAVATVDGQAIERQEFDRWLTIAAKSSFGAVPDREDGYRKCIAARRKALPPKDRQKVSRHELVTWCKQDYAQLRNQVMQLLISFKWIAGEAALQGITVTDAEVDQSFQEQKKQSFPKESDYRKFLKQSGQTEADILQRVRLDLLSNKLRDKVVAGKDQVSDEAIAQFYADNKARFAVPERRSLRIVLTKRKADAERARSALERGTSWKAVARRYSIDSTSKYAGGKLGFVSKGTLDRRLDKAVFGAVKDRLVGPVRTQYGYYVFTVTRVKPARQQPLEEVRDVIKETLVSEQQQAALDAFVKDFTARWRAKTICADGYKTSDCSNGPAPTPTPTPTS